MNINDFANPMKTAFDNLKAQGMKPSEKAIDEFINTTDVLVKTPVKDFESQAIPSLTPPYPKASLKKLDSPPNVDKSVANIDGSKADLDPRENKILTANTEETQYSNKTTYTYMELDPASTKPTRLIEASYKETRYSGGYAVRDNDIFEVRRGEYPAPFSDAKNIERTIELTDHKNIAVTNGSSADRAIVKDTNIDTLVEAAYKINVNDLGWLSKDK